jgi:hypothetical protein
LRDLGRFDCGVDFAMLPEPIDVASFGVQFDLAKQFNRLGLEAGFGGIGVGNYCLDLEGDNEPVRADEAGSLHSFPK